MRGKYKDVWIRKRHKKGKYVMKKEKIKRNKGKRDVKIIKKKKDMKKTL